MKHLFALAALGTSLFSLSPQLLAQENYVLQFDGVNDRVDMGNNIGGGVRTIEFWFRASSGFSPATLFPGYSMILRNDAAQINEYGVYMRGTDWPDGRGYLYFFMRSDGELHEIRTNADTWTTGEWYHLCGTISQSEGMKLYINGEPQAQTDPTGTNAIASSTEITAFGTWGDALIRYAGTQLDEVRFWNRALSQQEIQDRMCYWLVAAEETGLVGYWPMNEGSGSVIEDMSGLWNNGQIVGAAFEQEDNCISGWIGLEERAKLTTMTIFPNPWVSTLVLSFERPVANARLEIVNSLGQTVRTIIGLNGRSFSMERGALTSGVYILNLSENGLLKSSTRLEVAGR